MGLCFLPGDPFWQSRTQSHIGDDWRQFASACVRASRNKTATPDFSPIAASLQAIALQERVLMKELGAWAKRKG
nr:DUF4872 domain-containing protein [uncultured Pseudomonas sp.]